MAPSNPADTDGSDASVSSPRALGDYGERLAARHLLGQGLAILDRNWRCVRGELDIVAREAHELVVCDSSGGSGATTTPSRPPAPCASTSSPSCACRVGRRVSST